MSSSSKKSSKPFSRNAGDWMCPSASCGNLNFARRDFCNRCEAQKPKDESSKSATSEIGLAAAKNSRGLFSADDWSCLKCGNINWARRNTCNICQNKKFADDQRTGYGGGYNERDVVEYKEKQSSDSEYDEFGRRKKKKSSNRSVNTKRQSRRSRSRSRSRSSDSSSSSSSTDRRKRKRSRKSSPKRSRRSSSSSSSSSSERDSRRQDNNNPSSNNNKSKDAQKDRRSSSSSSSSSSNSRKSKKDNNEDDESGSDEDLSKYNLFDDDDIDIEAFKKGNKA